jgi:hypothetical protein
MAEGLDLIAILFALGGRQPQFNTRDTKISSSERAASSTTVAPIAFTAADVGPLVPLAFERQRPHQRGRPIERLTESQSHAAVGVFDFLHRRREQDPPVVDDGHAVGDALDFIQQV